MLKAAVPSPTATSSRLARPPADEARARTAREGGPRRGRGAVRGGLRASCFHSATTFSTIVGDGRALDHLDQLDLAEVGEQRAEDERARPPCRPAA